MNSELIIKILMNVLFISIFISMFFFSFGTYVEEKNIDDQLNILATNMTDVIKITGKTTNTALYNYINNDLLSPEKIKEIKENDNQHMAGNKKIIRDVTLYNIIFFVVIMSVVILLKINYRIKGVDMRNLVIESFIILFFIALTETIFIYFFGAKFISIDINNIKLNFFEMIKKYRDSVSRNL